jgi:hypothetical protein
MTNKRIDRGKIKTNKLKYVVVGLHNVIGNVWDIWKGIAIDNYLVMEWKGAKSNGWRKGKIVVRKNVKTRKNSLK